MAQTGVPALRRRLQQLRDRRVAKLPERLVLDLPNAFAGDAEAVTDFFERMRFPAAVESEAHPDNRLLTRSERLKRLVGDLAQIRGFDPLLRVRREAVFDQISELRFALLPDRRF